MGFGKDWLLMCVCAHVFVSAIESGQSTTNNYK